MEPLNARINQLIKALGIKKVNFATQIGVDQSYVTQLTNGRRNPSDRLISSICREFNVNENWLRNGEGEMFNTTPETLIDKLAKEYQLDELGRDIMMGYLQLSENERIAVNQLMQNIIDKRSSRRASMPPPKPPTPPPEPSAPDVMSMLSEMREELAATRRENAELLRQNQELMRRDAKRAADVEAIKEFEKLAAIASGSWDSIPYSSGSSDTEATRETQQQKTAHQHDH